ncbi:MAG: HNH endonuclease [Desulfurivibrionaceae bacterium]|nr:HNH endonuclease [Desulfurivibrionaceae bacterium]
MSEDFYFDGVDEGLIRQERDKARKLRKSGWWQKRIASGICYYCGRQFKPKELTMDHLTPLGRGGTSNKGNLVASCKECNNKKKNLLPYEWDEYMETIHSQSRKE